MWTWYGQECVPYSTDFNIFMACPFSCVSSVCTQVPVSVTVPTQLAVTPSPPVLVRCIPHGYIWVACATLPSVHIPCIEPVWLWTICTGPVSVWCNVAAKTVLLEREQAHAYYCKSTCAQAAASGCDQAGCTGTIYAGHQENLPQLITSSRCNGLLITANACNTALLVSVLQVTVSGLITTMLQVSCV